MAEDAFDVRDPEPLDYERLVAMLRADPGKRAEIDRALANNGKWIWKFWNPILQLVEYIEFDSLYEFIEGPEIMLRQPHPERQRVWRGGLTAGSLPQTALASVVWSPSLTCGQTPIGRLRL